MVKRKRNPIGRGHHMITIFITAENYENNMGILETIWNLLRQLELEHRWMYIRDGADLHPTWKLDEKEDAHDLMRVWEIMVNMDILMDNSQDIQDAMNIVTAALRPLNINLQLNFYSGRGSQTDFIGPQAYRNEFSEVDQALYMAVNAVVAYYQFDETGIYKETWAGTKKEKALLKLAKKLGLLD